MKKLMSTLAMVTMLVIGASQAHAALLTNWDYTLSDIKFQNINENFVTVGSDGSLDFKTGNYGIELETGAGKEEQLTFPGDNSSADSKNDTLVSQITSTDDVAQNTAATKIADITFSYSVVAVDNPNVRMSITYTIPLYTYYDAAAETAYIYYNNNEVSTRGATNFTHDGYAYGITGVGLFVDDRALSTIPSNDGNLYSSWAINDDTIKNNYSEYVVGEDAANTENSLGAKDTPGLFDITGVLSITNSKVTPDPAPTPEPATMLLMGLGLAGLGFVARRRNQK